MKNLNEINALVAQMDDALFEKIMKAENDYWDFNKRISRNGHKRMVYNLHKAGLTIDEWFEWCAN